MAIIRSAEFLAAHPVFTLQEYVAARAAAGGSRSPETARGVLRLHIIGRKVLRVRSGLYASVPTGMEPERYRVDPFLLATKLAPDAVIAYHSALQFWSKAHTPSHRYAVLTRIKMQPLQFQGSEFLAVRFPYALNGLPDLGGGIVSEPYADGTVRLTTLERTLVDVLHSPELGGGWEEVWRSLEMVEHFDLAAIVEHTLRRGSATTVARVGFFLEQHREQLFVEEEHLKPLREHAPRQPHYLDRKRRESGHIVKGWNLVVPEWLLNRAWAEVA